MTIRDCIRVSSFETEPREFKQWLSESTADRRLRVDTPIEPAPPTLQKSTYGVCQPIRTVQLASTSQPSFAHYAETNLRLVRLLEKQQEWYDARELARTRAASYLDIIDQHQKQWLNNQPSTQLENS
ncbi:MAG: hypothetical protein ACK5PB_18815 [Pirellula sp.]